MLCCPGFSPTLHPRGKYLEPSGEGGKGAAKKKEADRAGKKAKRRPCGARSVATGLESAEDTPPSYTPCGAAEVLWGLELHGGDR